MKKNHVHIWLYKGVIMESDAKWGAFEIVWKQYVFGNANILGDWFFLAILRDWSEHEIYKNCSVVHENTEVGKKLFVYPLAGTRKQVVQQIFITFKAIFGYKISFKTGHQRSFKLQTFTHVCVCGRERKFLAYV